MPPTPAVSRRCPRPSICPVWVAAVGGVATAEWQHAVCCPCRGTDEKPGRPRRMQWHLRTPPQT
ncbi:hypothetical protein PF005_g26311 [Phytophthora fragariae]|uniref:Uncharacterized protein n=1 Tax=Phytophthora fragariae TaxID=53985 RepID=A0A6A3TXE3_9STRA|nr:hypothetical protein PF003_g12056 [Phytophthora fragariae]KAE8938086.1 hypothetical protein PF009_g12026 [Phytophthora fragariae]KAE9003822.1 hypothetical protein PF011_g12738 [Phytophthora fragariae]KAE9076079.1 hypothetical protein PF010_g24045 [Phytophthora fragariae]KAE9105153.1 hypothetical protein PF007_g13798 [Phytophthora fragariae]